MACVRCGAAHVTHHVGPPEDGRCVCSDCAAPKPTGPYTVPEAERDEKFPGWRDAE